MSDALATNRPFGTESEDLLRMACQVAETGVAVPEEVTEAARSLSAGLGQTAPSRLRGAVQSLLMSEHPGLGLQCLHRTGALDIVLPELAATVDFSQEAGRRHKDVWEHTKQVVLQSTADPIVRWSALLHDIGKVPTRVMHPNGKVTFHRHAEVGAKMFDKVSRRFDFDRGPRGDIRFLIYNHLRANAYSSTWTDGAVRRFDKEMGNRLQWLVQLSLADVTSRRPGRKQEAALNVEQLMTRILHIRELDAQIPPLPPGLGNAIMETFKLPPSRQIGELRALCEKAVEEGLLEERREAEYYVAYLISHGFAAAPAPVASESPFMCAPDEPHNHD